MDSVPSLMALVCEESCNLWAVMSRLGFAEEVALMTMASSAAIYVAVADLDLLAGIEVNAALLGIPRPRERMVTPSTRTPEHWKKSQVTRPGFARWTSRTVTPVQRIQRMRKGGWAYGFSLA